MITESVPAIVLFGVILVTRLGNRKSFGDVLLLFVCSVCNH
jgi:hypothetical protein